jgi:argininosuccinate lyase
VVNLTKAVEKSSPLAMFQYLNELGRFAADWVVYASPEFGVLELGDPITTSSSLMPQKKNPDIFELIRGVSGAAVGRLMELMMVIKGLPSTYNKDLQSDKRPLREGVEEPIRVMKVFGASIPRIRPRLPGEGGPVINPAIVATDLVDYLVERKVSFREAHGIFGEAVAWAESKTRVLNTLTVEEWREFSPAFDAAVSEVFDPRRSVERKRTTGSTNPEMVRRQIARAKSLL